MELENLWTTEQLAEYLKVHEMTIYKLLQAEEIPAIKVGKKWRFRQTTIDRWLSERETCGIRNMTPVAEKRWKFEDHVDRIKQKEERLYDIFQIKM
jgi:excisionase family DNA binding protein